MNWSTNLAAAGNTHNPCLLILQSKGYTLWAEDDNKSMTWYASKNACRFVADTPAELLGIVVLWETYGNDWNRQKPDLLGEVLESSIEL